MYFLTISLWLGASVRESCVNVKCRILSQNPILILIRNRPTYLFPLFSPLRTLLQAAPLHSIYSAARPSREFARESVDILSDMLGFERKTLRRLLISLFFLAIFARYGRLIEKNILSLHIVEVYKFHQNPRISMSSKCILVKRTSREWKNFFNQFYFFNISF